MLLMLFIVLYSSMLTLLFLRLGRLLVRWDSSGFRSASHSLFVLVVLRLEVYNACLYRKKARNGGGISPGHFFNFPK